MCWGVTLRSPHPHARIRGIDITDALTVPGVWAVLTADDVPGENAFGLEHADQPVLASEFVRYEGEPVALVAADHPETARRAAQRIQVDYEVLPAVTDARRAMDADAPAVHRPGQPGAAPEAAPRRGRPGRAGRRLPRLRGRDAGPGLPRARSPGSPCRPRTAASTSTSRPSGCTSTSGRSAWPSGCRPRRCGCTLSGVGGAFGGREDLSVHVHACLLALRTGKPVKMSYGREESFFGHVHRHPALMHYEFGAETGRHAGLRQVRRAPGRRRLRVVDRRRRRQRRHAGPGPVPDPERRRGRLRGVHQQPAVRGDARLRLRAGGLRARGADGRAGRRRGRRPGGDPAAQRHAGGRPQHHRPDHRLRGPGRRAAADRARPAHAASRSTSPTSAPCPGRSATPPTARASGAASGTPSPTRTSASPRASTTTRPPACGWR